MSYGDVCRLCLAKTDLVYVFDERISSPSSMKEMINVTTGVEIQEKDQITRCACSKCLQMVLKIFKFRTFAQKNDVELRSKHAEIASKSQDTTTTITDNTTSKKNITSSTPTPTSKKTCDTTEKSVKSKKSISKQAESVAKNETPSNTPGKKNIPNSSSSSPTDKKPCEPAEKNVQKSKKSVPTSTSSSTSKKDGDSSEKDVKPKNDAKTVKNDAKTVKNDVKTVKNDVKTVKNDVKTVKHDVKTVKNDAKTVKNDAKTVVSRAPRIHPSVLKLFNTNRVLKLPASCLRLDICPSVFVDKLDDDLTAKYLPNDENVAPQETIQENTQSAGAKVVSVHILQKATVPTKISLDNAKNEKTSPTVTPTYVLKKNPASEDPAFNNNHNEKNKIVPPIVITNVASKAAEPEEILKRKSLSDIPAPKSKKLKLTEDVVVNMAVVFNKPRTPPGPKCKKPKLTEVADLNNVDTTPITESPISLKKTIKMIECDICNKSFHNSKDLKSHQRTHMVCQFCKTSFQSLQSKKNHIDNVCVIKRMMHNLPDVVLFNVLEDKHVISQWKQALENYLPAEESEQTNVNDTKSESPDLKKSQESEAPKNVCNLTARINDLISETVRGLFSHIPDSKAVTPKSQKPVVATETITLDSDDDDDQATSNSNTVVQTDEKEPANISTNNDAIKPNITIKNDFLGPVEFKGSDVKIMKELLQRQTLANLSSEKDSQTELPCNEDIKYNKKDKTYLFTNLKTQLAVYKIPVHITNGAFGVHFSYEPAPVKKKELNIWTTKPIDIEVVPLSGGGSSVAVGAAGATSVAAGPASVAVGVASVAAGATSVAAGAPSVAAGTTVTGAPPAAPTNTVARPPNTNTILNASVARPGSFATVARSSSVVRRSLSVGPSVIHAPKYTVPAATAAAPASSDATTSAAARSSPVAAPASPVVLASKPLIKMYSPSQVISTPKPKCKPNILKSNHPTPLWHAKQDAPQSNVQKVVYTSLLPDENVAQNSNASKPSGSANSDKPLLNGIRVKKFSDLT